MQPIPLKKLPALFDSFLVVFALKAQGLDSVQILTAAFDSVLELVGTCIVDDSLDNMSAADAPFLLECFLDQNLTDTVLGKWRALLSRLGNMFPEISLKIGDQTNISQPSILPKSSRKQSNS